MIDAAKALPTVPTVVKKSLVSKLAEIVALVGYVPKNGRNQHHGYNFALEADVLAAVRGHLADRQIMIIPSVVSYEWTSLPTKTGSQRICTQMVAMTILDGESPERIEFKIMGEGADGGDKATYKASTGAEKYALLRLFKIPTGDDPERDDPRATERVVAFAGVTPTPASRPAATEVSCPACGQLDAVMLSKFGPGYVCFVKKGGCGEKFLGAGAEQLITTGRRTAVVKAQLAARVAKEASPDEDAESAHITPWETMSRYLAAANLHGAKAAAFLRRITGKAQNENITEGDVSAVADALSEMGIDVGGGK